MRRLYHWNLKYKPSSLFEANISHTCSWISCIFMHFDICSWIVMDFQCCPYISSIRTSEVRTWCETHVTNTANNQKQISLLAGRGGGGSPPRRKVCETLKQSSRNRKLSGGEGGVQTLLPRRRKTPKENAHLAYAMKNTNPNIYNVNNRFVHQSRRPERSRCLRTDKMHDLLARVFLDRSPKTQIQKT